MDSTNPDDLLSRRTDHLLKIVKPADGAHHGESEPRLFLNRELSWLAFNERTFARNHFAVNVFPALTPLAVDPGHPFPHLRNRSLNLAVLLAKSQGKRRTRTPKDLLLAVVQVPMVLGRIVRLPSEAGKSAYT